MATFSYTGDEMMNDLVSALREIWDRLAIPMAA